MNKSRKQMQENSFWGHDLTVEVNHVDCVRAKHLILLRKWGHVHVILTHFFITLCTQCGPGHDPQVTSV